MIREKDIVTEVDDDGTVLKCFDKLTNDIGVPQGSVLGLILFNL